MIMWRQAFAPPSCSINQLGAVGAVEVVKGNWPELCILDLRWDWVAGMLCVEGVNCSTLKASIALLVT